jgi:hypothetical protein
MILNQVRHRVSKATGYAIEYNRNDDEPAWRVQWQDGYQDWYAPDVLEFIGGSPIKQET